MKPIFVGSGVALITPFDKDGKIDYDVFSRLIEFQISNKTDAIIVCGTTGEGSTLTVDERLELFDIAVKQVSGRVPVIAGTGSNSTAFSVELMKAAEKRGVDAHLSVTPYYNKASQNGIISHYYTLADNSTKPVIVYNVPSRTGVNITPETYRDLSNHPDIIAVKEADTSITKLQKSIELCDGKMDFYIGNDDMIAAATLLGCKGVISVLANILPKFTHNLAYAGINGNVKLARKMQSDSLDIIEGLFSDVSPIPVKYAMEHIYGVSSVCRLPLCPMTNQNCENLKGILNKHNAEFSVESVNFN